MIEPPTETAKNELLETLNIQNHKEETEVKMLELPSLRPETRYGMPAADKVLFNRHYSIGISYYFRQAKWALEIIDRKRNIPRLDNFRPDYRVPEIFRADLADYEGSGYDRGHLVPSADKSETELQNSETFLLSNMSPQKPDFNRGIWRMLEIAVRNLAGQPKILETYVISGPIFYFDQPIVPIPSKRDNDEDPTLPIPHAYFKSVLTVNKSGSLHMWSFMLPNEGSTEDLDTFRVETSKVEKYAGIFLWNRLVGSKMKSERNRIRKMWKIQ